MNSTSDNNQLSSEANSITTMDLGNSFDYVHDYYINSYDYTIDSTDSIIEDITHKASCKVVSTNDSINIVHDNGTDKHIQKKKYESASKKYNEKKAAKEKSKAIAKAQNKTNNTRTTSHAYKNHFNTTPSTSVKTTSTSHQEIFGNNKPVKRTSEGTIKLLIFLFVVLPYVASIFFSCVGEFFDSL